jgi:hypothetical protein
MKSSFYWGVKMSIQAKYMYSSVWDKGLIFETSHNVDAFLPRTWFHVLLFGHLRASA